jgi:hypothetical protein
LPELYQIIFLVLISWLSLRFFTCPKNSMIQLLSLPPSLITSFLIINYPPIEIDRYRLAFLRRLFAQQTDF